MKKAVDLLIALFQVIALALRVAWIYTRLRVKLILWRRYNRAVFWFKTRSLPAKLAGELRREYSETLSQLTPPGVREVMDSARRPRRKRGDEK